MSPLSSPPPAPSTPSRSTDSATPSPSFGAPRRGRRRLVRAVLVAALTVLVVMSAATLWGIRRLGDITYVDIAGVEPATEGTASNWLLVGSDDRSGIDPEAPDALAFLAEPVPGTRTDTIILARVDRDAKTVDLLSVPRDLWVPIAGSERMGRVNGAFNGENGRERLVETVSQSLNVPIHHYAEVDFVGFREMIDAMGGVPLRFEHPARDVGSGFEVAGAGCQVLDGTQALAYARSRRFEERIDGDWVADPTGDLGRTARQRRLLARLVDRAVGAVGSMRVWTVDELMATASRHLVVEDGVSVPDLLSLAATVIALDAENVVGHSLPVDDHRTDGGAQVLLLRDGEADPVLELFRTGLVPSAPSTEQTEADTEGGDPAVGDGAEDDGAAGAEAPDSVDDQSADDCS